MIQDKETLMLFRLSEPETYADLTTQVKDIYSVDGDLIIGKSEFLGFFWDETNYVPGNLRGYEFNGRRIFGAHLWWQRPPFPFLSLGESNMNWVVSLACDNSNETGFFANRFESHQDAFNILDKIESIQDPEALGFVRIG